MSLLLFQLTPLGFLKAVLLWQQRQTNLLCVCNAVSLLDMQQAVSCRDLTLALKEMLGVDEVWCWTPTQATSAQFVTWAQKVLDLRWVCRYCSLPFCL